MPDKPRKLLPLGFAGFEDSPAAAGGSRRKARWSLRPREPKPVPASRAPASQASSPSCTQASAGSRNEQNDARQPGRKAAVPPPPFRFFLTFLAGRGAAPPKFGSDWREI